MLYVSNLPFDIKSDDLLSFFRGEGAVSAHVAERKNGRSKGFGFVTFSSSAKQQRALERCANLKIGDREFKIAIAKRAAPRTQKEGKSTPQTQLEGENARLVEEAKILRLQNADLQRETTLETILLETMFATRAFQVAVKAFKDHRKMMALRSEMKMVEMRSKEVRNLWERKKIDEQLARVLDFEDQVARKVGGTHAQEKRDSGRTFVLPALEAGIRDLQ